MNNLKSHLATQDNTVIVIQLLHKINNIGKLLLVFVALSSCSTTQLKKQHPELQQRSCARLGVIYDSRAG